jgi:choline dehydrogenase-like flavoprotein
VSVKRSRQLVRDGTVSYWHQTCTPKMGHDSMSVVDGSLKVYGIDHLRIAEARSRSRARFVAAFAAVTFNHSAWEKQQAESFVIRR